MNSKPLRMLTAAWLLALPVALPSFALPPADSVDLANLGERVLSIPAANRISDFKRIDTQHVILSLSPDETYLVRLRDQCGGLSWAQHIGVTMSNNTIWAEFDAVTTDGLECRIQRINRVSRDELRKLNL